MIAQAPENINTLYSNSFEGKWFRLKGELLDSNPIILFEIIKEQYKLRNIRPGLYGILIKEEISHRKVGDGWVFLWIPDKTQLEILSKTIKIPNKDKLNKLKNEFIHHKSCLIRGLRAGESDIRSRIPELIGLEKKKILVIGLGCLGAPSVLELARNGIGEIRLWDYDFVEPGTITRWPMGLPSSGILKSNALANFISDNYPYCKTRVIPPIRIGGLRETQRDKYYDDYSLLEDAIKDVDLIYDASAEYGVQHFLSEIAYEKSVPYIKISATPGLWGGEIARIIPGASKGCWLCLYKAQEDQIYPLPNKPKASEGTIYTAGCGDRTFTGASFDSNIISMTGVRLSIATLLKDKDYHLDFNWDVAIINLRDENGIPIAPEFTTFELNLYNKCPRERH